MTKSNAWSNRTEIRSETSDRVYVVSQHTTRRYWGCSCPAWRVRRHCKHLEQLGLPGGEKPFEVEKDHGKKKGFLDGYQTYDTSTGHGSKANWQQAFAGKMGLNEARATLRLAADAGWDEVRKAFRLAATESTARLVASYEAAVRDFGSAGPVEEKAQAVKSAKFRIEAYAAYLTEQKVNLETEAGRLTKELLARIEAL